MKVIITFTFCCNSLWKSKFMALEKPGKLREFFSPTLWPPCPALPGITAKKWPMTKVKNDNWISNGSGKVAG